MKTQILIHQKLPQTNKQANLNLKVSNGKKCEKVEMAQKVESEFKN